MPMYMMDRGPMPMRGPYPGPMYPMHQQPHQAMPAPVDNSPAPAKEQTAVDTNQGDTSVAKKHEYCDHVPQHGYRVQKMKAMQQQQQQMQKHMQRMETHLANIESLIRQMVENR